ncbi:MAG TPA: acyl-CoA dehydrogenase C-terminal domain-containing protein, partial [Burkholderiaceae bacterium]|nr:acyl-CoA dehydrogenase C-terminal domain-containing protein [Burkholderiaceae bacterium]
GWQLARSLLVAEAQLKAGKKDSDLFDAEFMQAKIITAQFYAEHILSKAPNIGQSIVAGGASVTALPLSSF